MKRWKAHIVTMLLVLLTAFSMNVSAASPKLNKTKLTLNVGKSYTLKLNYAKSSVKWTSSDYVKAPITSTGKVTARKKGTVTLTAESGKKKYKCVLTIRQPVTKIKLDKTNFEMTEGKTTVLKATVQPSSANNKSLIWSSSNKKAVTVSSTGKVKAIGEGTALIKASSRDGSKKTAYCRIVVKKKTTSVNSSEQNKEKKPSAAAQKFLNTLQAMSDQVRSDYKAGRKWYYARNQKVQKLTYSSEWKKAAAHVAAGNTGYLVCSGIVRWGLTEAGIMNTKQHLYAKAGGTFHFNDKLKNDPDFNKKFEVLTVNKTPNQLLKEGNLLPGDICGWERVMHTNVYAGDGKWYDAGRGVNTELINGEYRFLSFGPSAGWMNEKIVQIVRLK